MAQIKQNCSVTNGSQLVTLAGNQTARIKRNGIFMVDIELVPYTVAADATYDGVATSVVLAGAYQGKTADNAIGVFVTDFTYPDMVPTIAQGDVGTAAVFTKAMYRLQELITDVLPTSAAAAAAASSVPRTGGSMTGPLSAPYLMSYGTGAAQPRAWMNQTGYGEPCLALARWTGQGENDSTWRFTNNNGQLQVEYTDIGRLGNQVTFASKLSLTKDQVVAVPKLRAEAGIYVGNTATVPLECQSSLLPWDGAQPVATERKEIGRWSVKGIPGVSNDGAFRIYTSSGPGWFKDNHSLQIFAWDSNPGSGQSEKPVLYLSGAGVGAIPALGAIRLPSGQNETGAGQGWMKIGKVRMGSLGTDFVIRVSGTTSYSANVSGSNGSLTTILGRIDNDNKIRGTVYTQGWGAFGTPSEVIFGDDGSIYMLCGTFYQLSVHADVHSGIWANQAVVYHSATDTPPAGIRAIKSFCVSVNGTPSLNITATTVDSALPFRGPGMTPSANATYALGSSQLQYTTAYLSTGAINASDARLKRDFRDLTTAEIAAARDIARAIGVYRWKDAVEAKASDAREHIGPTVQAVIAIMEAHNLDPFNYGFICHDVWDREVIEHPAILGSAAIPGADEVPAVIDAGGNVVSDYVPAQPEQPAMPGRDAYTEVVREAGDRYAFRYDELAMFIAAGNEARMSALEAALKASA